MERKDIINAAEYAAALAASASTPGLGELQALREIQARRYMLNRSR